jgi:exopolysaccharide production protein ExoZ
LTWRFNLGVDFFFVLSGFIITFAHEDDIGRPDRWRTYAAKRFMRVYPIYWIYTAALCALVLILPSTIVLPMDSMSWISIATLVRGNDVGPPLTPAWTLFHEMAFYCIFSFLIINRTIGTAVLAAWSVVIFARFSYAGGTPLLVWTSAYNLDFFVGIGAFMLFRRGARLCRIALIAGITIILASYVAELNGYSLTVFPLLYALGFGGIITGLASIETKASNISIPILDLLGDASYSVYLLHMPLQGFFMKAFIRWANFSQSDHILSISRYLRVSSPLLSQPIL